jgi:hypothetical protein
MSVRVGAVLDGDCASKGLQLHLLHSRQAEATFTRRRLCSSSVPKSSYRLTAVLQAARPVCMPDDEGVPAFWGASIVLGLVRSMGHQMGSVQSLDLA